MFLQLNEGVSLTNNRADLERLATFVSKLRKDRKLSLEALQAKGGPSSGWLSALERGTMVDKPKPETLRKLAKCLGVSDVAVFQAAGLLDQILPSPGSERWALLFAAGQRYALEDPTELFKFIGALSEFERRDPATLDEFERSALQSALEMKADLAQELHARLESHAAASDRLEVYRQLAGKKLSDLVDAHGEIKPDEISRQIAILLDALMANHPNAEAEAGAILNAVRHVHGEQLYGPYPARPVHMPADLGPVGITAPAIADLASHHGLRVARELVSAWKPSERMADYFLKFLVEQGLSPEAADEKAGAPIGSIGYILGGGSPMLSDLRKWSKRLGMLTREVVQLSPDVPASKVRHDPRTPVDLKQLPQWGEVACGKGSFVDADAETHNYWPAWMTKGVDGTMLVRGKSMAAVGYQQGDTLFLRLLAAREKPSTGAHVVAVNEDGTVICKIYRRLKGGAEFLVGAPELGEPTEEIDIVEVRVVAVVVAHLAWDQV
jgi:transcriptional regulator with XRE-family HTH domain/SOS-response transcriptional repressor LexA